MSLVVTKVKGTITGTAIGTADDLIVNATTFDSITGSIIFYNTDTSVRNVFVAVVNNSGGSQGTPASTDVIWSSALAASTSPGENWDIFDISQALTGTNDTLVAYASATAVVNYAGCYAVIPDQS